MSDDNPKHDAINASLANAEILKIAPAARVEAIRNRDREPSFSTNFFIWRFGSSSLGYCRPVIAQISKEAILFNLIDD